MNILDGVTDKDFVRMIAEKWAALSMTEKESIAGPRTSQMQEDRNTKLTGTHTCMVKAFHDVSATLCRVENIVSLESHLPANPNPYRAKFQLRDLCTRTGLEVLMFAVRSDIDQYNRPSVVFSSARVKDFFKLCFNQLPNQWVLKLEAFSVAGLDGKFKL